MIKSSRNIDMLQSVAEGLQDLLPSVVFVGGSTSVLYMNPATSAEPRPTDDVDCVVEISSYSQLDKLGEKLRNLGFQNDTRKGAPICRWLHSDLTVDVMPTDTKALGFSNSWYKIGVEKKEKRVLHNGLTIFVFPLSYFLASKLEAYHSRGKDDPRTSNDMEDILLVLDGHDEPLRSMELAEEQVKKFLRTEFIKLSRDPGFMEAIEGLLAHEGPGRVKRMRNIVESICKLR